MTEDSALKRSGPLTGAYFQKTLGVLPGISEDVRRSATTYIARRCDEKDDFLLVTDTLGLGRTVDEMAGEEWRNAS